MTYKVYLAAAFDRASEMQAHAEILTRMGIHVTSRWHRPDSGHTQPPTRWQAEDDLDDIDASNLLCHFTGGGRGGRIFETGYAYAQGLNIFRIGPEEHLFDRLAAHSKFDTWEVWMEHMTDLADRQRRDYGD